MKTNLTAETITDAQIRRLRDEAVEAGDEMRAAICHAALFAGERTRSISRTEAMTGAEARQACAEAINGACAQSEA